MFKKRWLDLKCFKKMVGSKVFYKKIGFAVPVFKKSWSDLKCFKKDDRIRSIQKKMIGFAVFKKR